MLTKKDGLTIEQLQVALEHVAVEQFRAARERVGGGLKKNAEWLLRFARQPLPVDGATTVEQDQPWADLLALGILAERSPENAKQDLAGKELSVWREVMGSMPDGRWIEHLNAEPTPLERKFAAGVARESVHFIQREVATVLGSLLARGTVAIPLTNAVLVVGGNQKNRLSFSLDLFQIDKRRSGVQEAVLVRLAQVLEEYAGRIRECQCGSIFIAGRTDQLFHNRNCQMKTLMKEKRAAQKRRQDALKLRRTPKKGGKPTKRRKKA